MVIPTHAKRVFQGEIFDVYQWEQKLFDGSIATFEALRRPDTALVMPVQGGKILLADQEQPNQPRHLTFFGGRVDAGEKPLEAAQRELQEEAGVTSDRWELLTSVQPYGKIEWTVHYFIAHDCRTVGAPRLDPGERITTHAVTFEEFLTFLQTYRGAGDVVPEGLHFTEDDLGIKKLQKKLEIVE